MTRLVPITADNWQAALAVRVQPERFSADNWRDAVAVDPAALELMARAYLGLGPRPLVEYDGDRVVGVRTAE